MESGGQSYKELGEMVLPERHQQVQKPGSGNELSMFE